MWIKMQDFKFYSLLNSFSDCVNR